MTKFEELITAKGFNLKNFAIVAGIERESMRQYRRGVNKPSAKNTMKIAKALGVSTDEVIKCFEQSEA